MLGGSFLTLLKPPRAPAELVESFFLSYKKKVKSRISAQNLIADMGVSSIHAARERKIKIKVDRILSKS